MTENIGTEEQVQVSDENLNQVPMETVILGDGTLEKEVPFEDTNAGIYKSLTAPTVGSGQATPTKTQSVAHMEFKENEIANPTFDIDSWALMPDLSTRLAQAIRLYARNTVGLGWKVSSVISIGKGSPTDLKERYEYEKTALLDLLEYPNDETPFSDLMFMVMTDKLTLGNGYIEVVRSQAGQIVELYHVKAKSVRVRKGGEGFVQIVGKNKKYFKNFGEMRNMNSETGKYGGRVPLKKRATEILHYKEYNTRDDYYGVPRYMSTAPAIMGNRAAAERNLAFFENDAVPRMALLIAGGKLAQGSVDRIQKFFKAAKGTKNAHRMMVIQIDTEGANLMGSIAKPDVQLQPLTVGENDDASFLKYRSANDEEIRESFGIARAFFSPDDVNKAVAYTTKAITNEQEFDPTQDQIEHMFYYTIIMDMFSSEEEVKQTSFVNTVTKAKEYLDNQSIVNIENAHFGGMFFGKANNITEEEKCKNKNYVIEIIESTKLYKFKKIRKDSNGDSIIIFQSLPLVKVTFDRPRVLDEAEKAEVNERYLETGVLTPNEVRQQLGMDSYDDDMPFGDTPLPLFERVGEVDANEDVSSETDDEDNEEEEESMNDDSSENESNTENNDNEGDGNNEEES